MRRNKAADVFSPIKSSLDMKNAHAILRYSAIDDERKKHATRTYLSRKKSNVKDHQVNVGVTTSGSGFRALSESKLMMTRSGSSPLQQYHVSKRDSPLQMGARKRLSLAFFSFSNS